MSDLSFWDHAFALLVFIIYPSYSALTVKKTLAKLESAGEPARIAAYRNVIASWVLFSVCLLGLWFWQERDWVDLGFTAAPLGKTMIAVAIAAIAIAIFVIPLRNMLSSPQEGWAALKKQSSEIAVLMPQTETEEAWFKGASLNAGLTEELIFRGYLIWYLQHFVPLTWAAVIAAAEFAIAHAYQGLKQIPGILLVSSIAVGLFIYTGSLLVPVLFHVFLDALQGHYIARLQRGAAVTQKRSEEETGGPNVSE